MCLTEVVERMKHRKSSKAAVSFMMDGWRRAVLWFGCISLGCREQSVRRFRSEVRGLSSSFAAVCPRSYRRASSDFTRGE